MVFFSTLLNHCLSLNSLKLIHAQLIKLSLCNTNTFLGNRCLDLYSKFGTIKDTLQAFHDIRHKNVFSWNIYMRVFVDFGDIKSARQVFDEMPERDVVSWNEIISGYCSTGFVYHAFSLFTEMVASGVTPSGHTYSIVLSFVPSVCHGMQIHSSLITKGVKFSSVIIGNSLIDMYCKHGCIDYAFGVFLDMEDIDVVSWNSLIAGFSKTGHKELAYSQFCTMRRTYYSPDAYTVSSVLTACSGVQDLIKGRQILCLSVKSGFLSNTIVSSAAINMFSKCESIKDSVTLFDNLGLWDSAVCNSMISSFTNHQLEENAMRVFVISVSKNIKPTEFTLSCLLSSASVFLPAVQGTQLHCLVVKLGFEWDPVVSSSLIDMYSKCGLCDAAKIIFDRMDIKDLVSWNSMILGLTFNGKTEECIDLFRELVKTGLSPDEVTLNGVLLACVYGRLIDKGLTLFRSMESKYGVKPTDTHLTFIVEMMMCAGEVNEAMKMITTLSPNRMNGVLCKLVLGYYGVEGDLELTERAAERLAKLEPMSLFPYMVLVKAYEARGRWESVARVKKVMKDRNIRKVVGCSWIGLDGGYGMVVFKENEVVHHGGEDVYSTLRLLMQDVEDESYK
ncbi:pentatricopeptide repeat-containing protein At1g43980, mitochondrial-like [Bidens hawaiensis]|uniref:pentatricopeptide repeat-containing protein At1g43980, mitochondrial-like n=1 Tax=Bidens hawaiensis TaxID=980011 RepID=UPI00404AAA30